MLKNSVIQPRGQEKIYLESVACTETWSTLKIKQTRCFLFVFRSLHLCSFWRKTEAVCDV